jgi:uncharacterized protein (TIGR04255 family)
MNLINYLKPCKEKHSVREAVITLFLGNEILNPNDFQKLHQKELNFDVFEIVKSRKVQLKLEPSSNSGSYQDQEIGFQFANFLDNEIKTALKGVNDAEGNNFIAYHTLDYVRWTPFKEDFLEYAKHLTKIQNNFLIKGFGIYYIDDFIWENETEKLPKELIFKKDGNVIPNHFFTTNNASFSLVTEQIANDIPFLESFNIDISNETQPNIRIAHNVLQILPKIIELTAFLNDDFHLKLIQEAHIYNKNMLKQILSEDVQNLISLT